MSAIRGLDWILMNNKLHYVTYNIYFIIIKMDYYNIQYEIDDGILEHLEGLH